MKKIETVKKFIAAYNSLNVESMITYLHPEIEFKNIFCLSEWHVDYFTKIFTILKPITVPFYYGCNISFSNERKIPYSFIYSSFPNRGLRQLLQMWKYIYENQGNRGFGIPTTRAIRPKPTSG